MSHSENIMRIKIVYDALEELKENVVFIGGATVSLYSERPAAEPRPTQEIDILVELLSYADYSKMEEKLRQKGFINDMDSKVICRYKIQGIIVDVMPTSEKILGFSNKWYPAGFANSKTQKLDEIHPIRIFSPEYFIATKLEAFKNRGNNDGRTSQDFEDIVFVLNNRSSIWKEMNTLSYALKAYFMEEWKSLLDQPYLYEWILANLEYSEHKRVSFILGGLHDFMQ